MDFNLNLIFSKNPVTMIPEKKNSTNMIIIVLFPHLYSYNFALYLPVVFSNKSNWFCFPKYKETNNQI